jgi:4-oxalomesaconate tautomerase
MSYSHTGVRCAMMRAGTSRGLFFEADDLPVEPAARDDLLMRLMGTPDPLQIDGLGGATSLTSKVAVVSPSTAADADVDYLFLQVGVDAATVSDRQNCGNILAGIGPFAVERCLVQASDPETSVRIRMVNSDSIAVATFPTPGGRVDYRGDVAMAGVPGTAAPVVLALTDLEGSTTGSLLPTGSLRDRIAGIDVTCIDNGMPVVLAEAAAFGLRGNEPHEQLAADASLLARIDTLRRQAAHLMGLGDVTASSVPKTVLVAPPAAGGDVATRSFIPVQPHSAVGVFAAVSAVTGLRLPGSVGHHLTADWAGSRVAVEHPTGSLLIDVEVDSGAVPPRPVRVGVVRTTRLLFDGTAYPRA